MHNTWLRLRPQSLEAAGGQGVAITLIHLLLVAALNAQVVLYERQASGVRSHLRPQGDAAGAGWKTAAPCGLWLRSAYLQLGKSSHHAQLQDSAKPVYTSKSFTSLLNQHHEKTV